MRDYNSSYWKERQEQQRQRQDDAYWEEQARLRLLREKFKPACPSCGYRHRGAVSQSEELRALWCRTNMSVT